MSAPTTNLVRLIVEAGKASPSPPVGPALGSRGIKAMDFCKLFNAQTSHIEPTIPIRVNMTINAKDKSYKFKLNSPPTTYFIKKHLNASSASSSPSSTQSSSSSSSSAKKSNTSSDSKMHSFIGSELSLKFIYHLALIKKSVDHEDLNHIPLESLTRSIAAQVKNMGIKLVP
ncbi:hypothetical protein PGT21_026962 [Puccinia graminis f. sp. tritici]|uniref:Large subunit ribosomal protein L11 n=2 Tax=Puccinia graminis f. sp. tritici TaxID=56615 RepID=E3KD98_PUCGT|nr:mitochondrial 54S ribosomal protein YmL19 [Puccinia graminis f. sp. tritici CRL 75-36-700-3]KAA1063797.1 hypothetical protein PGTUg99_006037 [Puccinia graminis f. sp. tritici]EFP82312.1 large subunit ribosomal protein L11 [Puccinia graminis f. sp. tritici CRL 75-36-700-3]KAA1063806.1 hypothetical protein PGTUg99_001685 [Puccinia graminis f. sp. tritici]KAA1065098.1 hypothetical protein PGT21_024951 [Puccinia graminis f. sp. tritici]KAA1065109.1 hypothetical protein PGT21_025057 [Puccinia gr